MPCRRLRACMPGRVGKDEDGAAESLDAADFRTPEAKPGVILAVSSEMDHEFGSGVDGLKSILSGGRDSAAKTFEGKG